MSLGESCCDPLRGDDAATKGYHGKLWLIIRSRAIASPYRVPYLLRMCTRKRVLMITKRGIQHSKEVDIMRYVPCFGWCQKDTTFKTTTNQHRSEGCRTGTPLSRAPSRPHQKKHVERNPSFRLLSSGRESANNTDC